MDATESDKRQDNRGRELKNPPTSVKSQDPTVNSSTATKECHKHKKEKNWPQRIECVCAVALVFITGFYTYYARQQAKSANTAAVDATQSLNTLRTQFQLDQRPYISIVCGLYQLKTGRGIKKAIIGEPLDVTVFFKNIGKSIALDTIVHRHLLFGEQVKNIRSEPADDNKSGLAIDPGTEDHTSIVSQQDTFANESFAVNPTRLVNWDGIQPVIVFGRFTYEDLFGNKYCTPILERLLPNGEWLVVQEIGVPNLHKREELCPEGKLVIMKDAKTDN
jgi:hypothetical protein